MDCLPIDDACMIRGQIESEVYQPADDLHVNQNSFSLGVMNGRSYTYTWLGGMPTILIENVEKGRGIDALSLDVLVSDSIDDF